MKKYKSSTLEVTGYQLDKDAVVRCREGNINAAKGDYAVKLPLGEKRVYGKVGFEKNFVEIGEV